MKTGPPSSRVVLHPDGRAAQWLVDSLSSDSLTLSMLVPPIYEAYARVLNPVVVDEDDAPSRRDWRSVAGQARVVDAYTDWDEIATEDGEWEPEMGSLDVLTARRLVTVLRRFTETPGECFFAVWHGYAETPQERAIPAKLPWGRDMFVYSGTVDGASEPIHERVPLRWWPADHRWCVAGDLYDRSVYVGGSAATIAELLAAPSLEAFPIDPNVKLWH